MCGNCGGQKAASGKSRCSDCLQVDAAYQHYFRSNPNQKGKSKIESFLDPTQQRIGVLDIETTGLAGDFAVIFCVVVKIYGRDERRVFKLQLRELDLLSAEKRMLRDVRNYIRTLDGVITYYGTGFDIPFLRTRMLSHGLEPFAKVRHLDLYYTVRGKLLLSRNRLMNVIELLKTSDGTIPDKGRVAPPLWMRALYSRDTSALKAIIDHCVEDVDALEAALNKLRFVAPDIVQRR